VWAVVDAERLGRALLNLLSNATMHGRPGGTIRLELVRRPGRSGNPGEPDEPGEPDNRGEPEEALFTVADDGPGIPEVERERIFERFVRAGPERGGAGSGLGLAIAKAMVELHRGRIWVEATPGGGATFRIALPIAPDVPAAPTEPPGAARPAEAAHPAAGGPAHPEGGSVR
jgi:signal transduction histidine kinase